MGSFMLVKKNPTLNEYERNPYYWKVDPEGNQLPYIDKIVTEITANQEVIAAKASTGQVDFSGKDLNTDDIPLFKIAEKHGQVKALKENLLAAGAAGALLSGSGSSLYGVFADRQACETARENMAGTELCRVFTAHSL